MSTSYPIPSRATPAPPSNPTQIQNIHTPVAGPPPTSAAQPSRKSETPAPQIVRSPSTKPVKMEGKKGIAQSPVNTMRPQSTVPPAQAAIPPHMQQYQVGRSTPSPPSHHGGRPSPKANAARSPMPTERPLSAAPVQIAPSPAQHNLHPQGQQQQQQPQARVKTPHGPSPRVPSAQPAPPQQQHQSHQTPRQAPQQIPQQQPPQGGQQQPQQPVQQHQPPHQQQQQLPPQHPQQTPQAAVNLQAAANMGPPIALRRGKVRNRDMSVKRLLTCHRHLSNRSSSFPTSGHNRILRHSILHNNG